MTKKMEHGGIQSNCKEVHKVSENKSEKCDEIRWKAMITKTSESAGQ